MKMTKKPASRVKTPPETQSAAPPETQSAAPPETQAREEMILKKIAAGLTREQAVDVADRQIEEDSRNS